MVADTARVVMAVDDAALDGNKKGSDGLDDGVVSNVGGNDDDDGEVNLFKVCSSLTCSWSDVAGSTLAAVHISSMTRLQKKHSNLGFI